MMKDLGKIIKEMYRMINNPLTKWVVILWFVLYMTYIFFIFDTIQCYICITYMCAECSISVTEIEVINFKL